MNRVCWISFFLFFTRSSCILLTADADADSFKLICIVEKLRFKTSFYDPVGREQAFCLPPVPTPYCNSNTESKITQNFRRNKTILTLTFRLPTSRSLIGNWSCKNRDRNAVANVYIPPSFFSERNVILLPREFLCEYGQNLSMICEIEEDSSSFEFEAWTHKFNQVSIRHLSGQNSNGSSRVTLSTCTYQDTGNYTCDIKKMHPTALTRLNKTVKLIVTGPPVITATQIYNETTISLCLEFLSVPDPVRPLWYSDHNLISNSKLLPDIYSKTNISVHMHGRNIQREGFVAELVVENSMYYTMKYVCVVLQNTVGKVTHCFETKSVTKDVPNAYKVQTIVLILAGIVVFKLTVVISTILHRWRSNKNYTVSPGRVYFGASQTEASTNAYSLTHAHYEEIDDSALVDIPITSNNNSEETSSKSSHSDDDNAATYMEILE